MWAKLFSFSVVFLMVLKAVVLADVNVFLNMERNVPATIHIKSLKLIFSEKKMVELAKEVTISSDSSWFGQFFIGRFKATNLTCNEIKLFLDEVTVWGTKKQLCFKNINIPLSLKLKDTNQSLFIVWHVKEGLKDSCYQPVFSAYIQQTPMRKELLVSVCEDVNTLFFIRTDTNRVEASFLTKRKPEDVCVACDNNLVFILSEGDRSLQVVSTSPLRNVDIFTLPFVIAPYRMGRVKEGMVVIADRNSGYVVVLDVRSGEILRSKRIGFGIADVATSEDKDLIAVSVPEEQKVYFFNSNLELLGTIRVPGCPFSLWIDRDFVYVTNTTTGNVEVYNLGTFKHKTSVFSGRKPVDILDTGKKVYVANEAENSITVFDKAQYVRLKKIKIDGSPWDITFCRIKNWLYVSLKDKKKIAVIDVVRDKIAGYIDIGCAVSAMCVNPGLGAEQLCW